MLPRRERDEEKILRADTIETRRLVIRDRHGSKRIEARVDERGTEFDGPVLELFNERGKPRLSASWDPSGPHVFLAGEDDCHASLLLGNSGTASLHLHGEGLDASEVSIQAGRESVAIAVRRGGEELRLWIQPERGLVVTRRSGYGEAEEEVPSTEWSGEGSGIPLLGAVGSAPAPSAADLERMLGLGEHADGAEPPEGDRE